MYDVLVEDLMAKSSDGVLHEVQNFAAAFTAFAVGRSLLAFLFSFEQIK